MGTRPLSSIAETTAQNGKHQNNIEKHHHSIQGYQQCPSSASLVPRTCEISLGLIWPNGKRRREEMDKWKRDEKKEIEGLHWRHAFRSCWAAAARNAVRRDGGRIWCICRMYRHDGRLAGGCPMHVGWQLATGTPSEAMEGAYIGVTRVEAAGSLQHGTSSDAMEGDRQNAPARWAGG